MLSGECTVKDIFSVCFIDYCLGLLVYKIKSEAFCFLQGKEMTSNSHRYVPLNSLKTHTKVDVYGVVKFFKPPYKSRGSGRYSIQYVLLAIVTYLSICILLAFCSLPLNIHI